MRKRASSKGLTVNAIAGTYVVFLGLNLAKEARKGCLGFAIHRTDVTEDESYWMEGMKVFEETDPGLDGGKVSSDKFPFQTFQWSDFSAKPNHKYVYRVVALYGSPTDLTRGAEVSVDLKTEKETGGTHSVFFNRGAVSSQEYARRFQNRAPSEVGPPAYTWLSRGMLEAFRSYVARATDSSYSIHAAVYEFQWHEALDAFKDAHENGAKVNIIVDEIPGDTHPKKKNVAAITKAKIKSLCDPRTVGTLMHNKFVVLSKNGEPISVWTGSTNLTENGIFGHSNCGHIVENKRIAKRYLEYWTKLHADKPPADMRIWAEEHSPIPEEDEQQPIDVIFSPHTGLAVLDHYAQIADVDRPLFMTFAFGMHDKFQAVYERDDNVLRMALMEKEGNGAGLAQGKIDVKRIRKRSNVIIAIGNNIALNRLDRWIQERRSLSSTDNVHWIHTKYMLVDPLSSDPIIVTGSANFSKASTDTNDENMLIIRGDLRTADIYFTEYTRLFAHYAFREVVARNDPKTWKPKPLFSTDEWLEPYLTRGEDVLRRLYFSGSDH